jgi:RHS repeat-associated protein
VGEHETQLTSTCKNLWAQYNGTVNGTNNNQMSATSQNTSQGSSYDAAGNVTYDGTNFYAYDGEGRQCAVYDALSSSMTAYVYDAEGGRVAKGTVTGLTAPTVNQMMTAAQDCNLATSSNFTPRAQYLLDQVGNQVTELSGSGSNLAWAHTNIWAGGTLDATYDTKGLHFHLADPLGTRRVQLAAGGTNPSGGSAAGTVEEYCLSQPFGDALDCYNPSGAPATADDATEHHFTGKERDTESGNDYFGARYYASSMGRFLSPDWSAKVMPVPYAKLDNPQSLNLYAYVGNNPLNRTDPTGHYEAGCASDVKKCSDQVQKLDKQLQAALKSKDPNIVKAAQAYGKLGDKNGVNVTFMNVVDPKNANVTGTTSAQAGTGGITVDQATGKVQQATQVNLQAGMSGSQLQETAVHEGVHVEDRANFINTIQMTPYSFNQNLNISGRQSEMNAYGVENSWRQANGMPTIDINDQLSHPPYSTNQNIDKPILPDFPGPQ